MSNPYPADVLGSNGNVRISGAVNFTDPDNQPGGGSIPEGALLEAEFAFTEQDDAGTYTAELPVLAGTVVQDVMIYNTVQAWNSGWDTVSFDMGDTQSGATAYFSAMDLLSVLQSEYTPNGPSLDQNYVSLRYTGNGSGYRLCAESVRAGTATNTTDHATGPGVRYPDADTITMTVTTTGTADPINGAVLTVRIRYATPLTVEAATFEAA